MVGSFLRVGSDPSKGTRRVPLTSVLYIDRVLTHSIRALNVRTVRLPTWRLERLFWSCSWQVRDTEGSLFSRICCVSPLHSLPAISNAIKSYSLEARWLNWNAPQTSRTKRNVKVCVCACSRFVGTWYWHTRAGKVHWVAQPEPGKEPLAVELRLYDRLFSVEVLCALWVRTRYVVY